MKKVYWPGKYTITESLFEHQYAPTTISKKIQKVLSQKICGALTDIIVRVPCTTDIRQNNHDYFHYLAVSLFFTSYVGKP